MEETGGGRHILRHIPASRFPRSCPPRPLDSDLGPLAVSRRRPPAEAEHLGLGLAPWGPGRLPGSPVGATVSSPLECPCPWLALDKSCSSPRCSGWAATDVHTDTRPSSPPQTCRPLVTPLGRPPASLPYVSVLAPPGRQEKSLSLIPGEPLWGSAILP